MSKYILILFLFIQYFPVFSQVQVMDKIIATVGGELILLSELEEQFALALSQKGDIPQNARCEILEQLLTSKLLINQSKLDSIEVGDEEVENQLAARIDRILSFMNNDLKQFEEYYGQSVNDVKEQFRTDLKNQLLSEKMKGEIMKDITITPSEVKAFFSKIPKDSLPYFNSEVEIGEIVIVPKVNDTQRQITMNKLEGIRKRIVENKEDFAVLAGKFSADGSAQTGGDLGWATRGKYVPEFEAAAYKLEINEISEVVESQFGFHLIQLMGRRGNSINVRHILLRPEITEDDFEIVRRKLDSVRTLILNDSITFSYAVKKFSYDKAQSYNNDGRMVNPVTGNTFFEVGDLDPDIYFAIDTLKVKGITAPIEFRDPSGEVQFHIIQLQSKTPPHKANLLQDYSKIQKASIESKKNDYINTWIDEKISSTFIRLEEKYGTCPNLDIWINQSRGAN
ncbi:MAG: peptidylprolyl isomerase [Bacteroidetes bacterium]|jgi:peptidyl-prolyl cis-trans isomerase SurA|nr:peptidylprolyl isomerase [Bacteroidota bacterium]